jgi:hypothetical protein
MKKNYWLFMFILTFAFSGCSKDDDGIITPTPKPPTAVTIDSIAPQIELLSPKEATTYLAIGKVFLQAIVKDDKGLKEIRVFIVDPSGTRKQIKDIPNGNVENTKHKDFTAVVKPGSVVTGVHTLLIEAEDKRQNITTKPMRIKVIAEELSKVDFYTAFTTTGWYELVDSDEEGLDLVDFNYAFYSFVGTSPWDYGTVPATVDEFGQDFGNHSQLRTKWDTDKDGYLSYDEVATGLKDLNFFETWDTDKNNQISKAELTEGVKVLWDINKDNVVTVAEFERKLLKYFLS